MKAEPSTRLNSSTLVIGETKSGKTTLVATLAEWLWEEHRKVLFFNTAELGGFSSRVEQRIRQGLIRPFRMRTRDDVNNSLSFETMHLSSKGYVPARFIDHLSGEVEPGVPMVPPVLALYTQVCPHCGDRFQTRARTKITNTRTCAKCRHSVTLAQTPATIEVKQTPGFEQIGTFGFDGLTSFSDWYLQDMSHRKNLEGEKAALGGDIVSGDMVFRGNNRSQVGQAQTRVHELVANSLGIPNLVVMPVWTAIAHESSDDTGRLQIVGPKLAGDAKTYIAASWFGSVLEAQVVTNEKNEYIRRLYVTQWYDEFNRRHMCGHRGDPRFMPVYVEDAPYSDQHPPREICTGFSLANYQRLLEDSLRLGIEADTAFKDAPGISAIPATYGGDLEDGDTVAQTTPAAGSATRKTPGVARPRMPAKSAAAAPSAPAPATPPAPATAPDTGDAEAVDSAPVEDAVSQDAQTAPQGLPVETASASATEGAETTDVSPATEAQQPELPVQQDAAPATPAAPAAATAAPPAGSWTRPPGARPAPPRAPQAGPKPPSVRSAARPMTTVKSQ